MTKIDSAKVFDLARKFAAEAAAKRGQEFWEVGQGHINMALRELEAESGEPMHKRVDHIEHDDELLRKAREAQAMHTGLLPRQRIEYGDVPVEGGRVMVQHDQAADVVILHGHPVRLGEIDVTLRDAFLAASASYVDHMQDQQEQVRARSLIGAVVESIMNRHDFVGAEVRRRLQSQRYD